MPLLRNAMKKKKMMMIMLYLKMTTGLVELSKVEG